MISRIPDRTSDRYVLQRSPHTFSFLTLLIYMESLKTPNCQNDLVLATKRCTKEHMYYIYGQQLLHIFSKTTILPMVKTIFELLPSYAQSRYSRTIRILRLCEPVRLNQTELMRLRNTETD